MMTVLPRILWIGTVYLCLILNAFVLCQEKQPNLVIMPSMGKLSRAAGQDFVFTCVGDNSDDKTLFSNIKWFGPDNNEITPSSSGHLKPKQYTEHSYALIFTNPAPEHSGTYYCTGTYDNAIDLRAESTIEFYRDITWGNCPLKQSLVVNKKGKVICPMNTNPGTIIMWEKDGKAVSPSERFEIEHDGISFGNVLEADGGLYTITASVQETGTLQMKTINVLIQIPPNIVEIPSTVDATEGEEAIITCKAKGQPSPIYRWVDNQQHDLHQGMEGFEVDRDKGTLRIKEVKKEHDGVYVCWAENAAGKVSQEVELVVMVKPEIRHFTNLTVDENGEARMECEVKGTPLPTIKIRKQDSSTPFLESSSQRIIIHKEQKEEDVALLTLVIDGVMKSDDGLYYCTGENPAGHASTVGHIQVEYKPDFSTSHIRTLVKTWKGRPANVSCLASANPNATITWYYQNDIIDPSDTRYHTYTGPSSSHLLVRPLNGEGDVFGKYTCEARNRLGESRIDITLEESFVPGSILGVNHTLGSTSIAFTLRPPLSDGGSPIATYHLEYKQQTEQYRKEQWSGDLKTYVLEGLVPRTTYKVRFAASNDVGTGPWGSELTLTTQAESAPDIPKFIGGDGIVGSHPDQFPLSWTIPNDNGRSIDFFHLRYFEVFPDGQNRWLPSDKNYEVEINDFSSGPRYTLMNLKPDSYYKVEIRAHNIIGFSQDDSIVFKTLKGPEIVYGDEQSLMAPQLVPYTMIAAVSAVLFLVVLLVIDVICFVRCQCGVIYTINSSLCHRGSKESCIEDGKHKTKDTNGQLKPDSTDSGKISIVEPNGGSTSETSPMLQGEGNGSKPIQHTITTNNSKPTLPKDSAV